MRPCTPHCHASLLGQGSDTALTAACPPSLTLQPGRRGGGARQQLARGWPGQAGLLHRQGPPRSSGTHSTLSGLAQQHSLSTGVPALPPAGTFLPKDTPGALKDLRKAEIKKMQVWLG